MPSDIFAVDESDTDIFRYSEPMPWSHRQNVAPEAAPTPPPEPPKPPELPPAVEAAASATQGNREAVKALTPKAPKPPKPAAPPPPVLSKPNDLGFHESTIKRALETWQLKGTPQQLLAHIGKHQGASQEAELTGLHAFLHGKPNVTRDEVLNHLESNPHQPKMVEHDEASGPGKWHVHSDGDSHGDAYDSEDEAATAAAEANEQHQQEYRDQFEIEGDEPHYTVDTSALEALEEKEKELGGEMTSEASRALQRLGRSKFEDKWDALNAIDDYMANHLLNVYESGEGNHTDAVQEHHGQYNITSSPLSGGRHRQHFGKPYDSKDEAQDAIDEYIRHYWEPPYSYSQAEGGNLESVPEEYRWLPGPQKNYNETHVAVPGLKANKPNINPADYKAELVTQGNHGSNQFSIQNQQGQHLDAIWVPSSNPEAAIKSFVDYHERQDAKSITWKDGHDQYHHIDNPVVRIRHDDRETTDGKKLFMIEELQGPQDNQQEKMPSWLQDRIYDVGLKRALMKAVQGGYDRLGWTTGNHQADRYNLRKAVDRIEAHHIIGDKEYYQVIAYKDGKEKVKELVKRNELPEYVGKEVAEKLLASPGNLQQPHALEGPDLELGGRGLKDLYDRDLHKRLLEIKIGDKKLKNLGVKISKSEIPNGKWEIVRDGEVVGSFDSERAAENAVLISREEASVEPGTDTVHSVDIPPELAAEIKRHGVSLYAKRPSSPGSDGPLLYSRDKLLDIVRRMPASEAVVYAAGVLRLLDLRPMLMREYSVEELAYLRGIVQQFGGR